MHKTSLTKTHKAFSAKRKTGLGLAIFFMLFLWGGNVAVATEMLQKEDQKEDQKNEQSSTFQSGVKFLARYRNQLVAGALGFSGAALWWYKGSSSAAEILTKAASNTTSWILEHKAVSALGTVAAASVLGVVYIYKNYFPEVVTERNITQVAAGVGIASWLSSSFGAVGVSAGSFLVGAGLSGWVGNKVFEQSGAHEQVEKGVEKACNAVLPTKDKVVGLAKESLPELLGGGEGGPLTKFLEEHWGGDNDDGNNAAGVAAYIGTKVADLIGVCLGVSVMYAVLREKKKAREKANAAAKVQQ